ncbi:MAG TPA: alpha/beta hydrolase [Baekduia sp.]|uniref:alpha/beta fold hydrolase n=1 Tax=Baekduia sp. TaxID=2600305 RepID=UPI002C9B795D|nr:alpha/beta hydrolase [Baekduia sp.]HMJ37109.1 alpha/beta hydrolase [Baekduia sp.]
MTIDHAAQARPADQTGSDPFGRHFEVAVAGGALNVACAGRAPDDSEAVVLAVHGVTASHMTWRTVARQLAARPGACLVAPDLRGRGRSATLPGPYGLATHMDDLTAVLDHVGVQRAVLVGHSMGAHLVARLSAEQPERAAGLVLLDGGLPCPAPVHESDAEPEDADLTPGRTETPCASADDYLADWRAHPAFKDAWDDDVDAYARYDMAHDGRAACCVVRDEAVMADSFDLLFDGVTSKAITRVRTPTRLLRAPRGPLDDDCPVIPREYLDEFAAGHPHLDVEHVPGTNHYTIVLGNSPGPARVATAIETAIQAAERSHAD